MIVGRLSDLAGEDAGYLPKVELFSTQGVMKSTILGWVAC